jgi:hypothetical protein
MVDHLRVALGRSPGNSSRIWPAASASPSPAEYHATDRAAI